MVNQGPLLDDHKTQRFLAQTPTHNSLHYFLILTWRIELRTLNLGIKNAYIPNSLATTHIPQVWYLWSHQTWMCSIFVPVDPQDSSISLSVISLDKSIVCTWCSQLWCAITRGRALNLLMPPTISELSTGLVFDVKVELIQIFRSTVHLM